MSITVDARMYRLWYCYSNDLVREVGNVYNNSFKLTAKSFLRTYVRSDKLIDRENPKEGPRKRSYEIHLTQLRVDAIFRMYSAIYLFEIDIFFDRVPFWAANRRSLLFFFIYFFVGGLLLIKDLVIPVMERCGSLTDPKSLSEKAVDRKCMLLRSVDRLILRLWNCRRVRREDELARWVPICSKMIGLWNKSSLAHMQVFTWMRKYGWKSCRFLKKMCT